MTTAELQKANALNYKIKFIERILDGSAIVDEIEDVVKYVEIREALETLKKKTQNELGAM